MISVHPKVNNSHQTKKGPQPWKYPKKRMFTGDAFKVDQYLYFNKAL